MSEEHNNRALVFQSPVLITTGRITAIDAMCTCGCEVWHTFKFKHLTRRCKNWCIQLLLEGPTDTVFGEKKCDNFKTNQFVVMYDGGEITGFGNDLPSDVNDWPTTIA